VLLEQDAFFAVAQPYAEAPDLFALARRFAFFSRAVIAYAARWGADVVHLNDWQTGLAPLYAYLDGWDGATVFGIHNLPYQGNFPPAVLREIGVPEALFRTENGLEFYGRVSFMKAGLAFADRLVTVSPTYAKEIQTPEFGAGLDGLLRFRRRALHGILNGINPTHWDPARDASIPVPFEAGSIANKDENRTALLQELGLTDGGPLVVMVTRLAHQKGIDLVLGAMPRLLELGMRFALLGDGGPEYVAGFEHWASRAPERVACRFRFDDGLARRLYAGGDFFLMPSLYEPCGLGQMIAQRYGTVPVARRTGGLNDTIVDGRTGFLFDTPRPEALGATLERAAQAWRVRGWTPLRKQCMRLDRSWDRSARHYRELYRLAEGRIGAS
jgi:starch synthase